MICFKNPPKNDFTTNLKHKTHPRKIIFCYFGKGLFGQKYLQPHPFSTCHEIHEKWNWGTNCALLLLHMYIHYPAVYEFMLLAFLNVGDLHTCDQSTVNKVGSEKRQDWKVSWSFFKTTSKNQIVFSLPIAGWYFCSF